MKIKREVKGVEKQRKQKGEKSLQETTDMSRFAFTTVNLLKLVIKAFKNHLQRLLLLVN